MFKDCSLAHIRLSFLMIHYYSTFSAADGKKLELIQEDQVCFRLWLQMVSRPDSWTHINLSSNLQVKDTKWFSNEGHRARGCLAKVMLWCMTDTTAKKCVQCL